MAHTYSYAVLQMVPFAHREEVFNAGVVVVRPDSLEVRLGAAPQMLAYFGITQSSLEWLATSISTRDVPGAQIEERLAAVGTIPGIRLSEIGWFVAEDDTQYAARLSELLVQYVQKPTVQRSKKSATSIASDLKRRFKKYGLFGAHAGDIEKHKIVSNMPVGPSGKLHVDFLLKNSAYHATETIDFRRSQEVGVAELKSAALVSVTFQHARDFLGPSTRCYLVFATNTLTERTMTPAIDIAQREVTDLFNIESEDDSRRYFEIISSAAGSNGLALI